MRTISLILSIAAISFSIVALMGHCATTTADGALTIITICVTIIVGVSVIDTLTIHNLEKKIEKLTEKQVEFEAKEKSLNSMMVDQKINTNISLGVGLVNWLPFTSFSYFVKGLEKALETNNTNGISNCLLCMENVPKVIKRSNIKDFDDKAKKKGIPQISEESRRMEAYKLIYSRVEKVFTEMNQYYQSV